jgi:N-acetylglucosamine kinase-like BadF-type ATPase
MWQKRSRAGGGFVSLARMEIFLGVDAGGTGTRALLVDASGVVRGAGSGGPGNWQAVGVEAAGAAVVHAVAGALGVAGLGARAVAGAFFGLAGVRTDEERALWAGPLGRLGLGGPVGIGGDLVIAHAGALAGGVGVVVIAGTGSAAWGRDAAGGVAQAGGWGWLVDDQGGGYWLALRGLAAAAEAEDGRGPATSLGARAAAWFGLPGLREILRELHAGRRDRAAVAGFAREVRAAAEAGDAVAAGLVCAAGAELLRLAEAVRGRLAPDATGLGLPLAVVGGLGLGPVIAEEARRRGFRPVEPWGEPVLGAVLLGARAAGVELDAGARARLLAGWKTPL